MADGMLAAEIAGVVAHQVLDALDEIGIAVAAGRQPTFDIKLTFKKNKDGLPQCLIVPTKRIPLAPVELKLSIAGSQMALFATVEPPLTAAEAEADGGSPYASGDKPVETDDQGNPLFDADGKPFE